MIRPAQARRISGRKASATNQRQEGLGDTHLPEKVDLELLAEQVHRNVFHRRRCGKTRVVDQCGQAIRTDHLPDRLGGCTDELRAGHVDGESRRWG